jgi:hypothetical protein
MSFNTKSKINIGSIDYKEISIKYEKYTKDKSYDHLFNNLNSTIECMFCKKIKLQLNFGIPLYIKEVNSKLEVGVHGSYCSFICAYKHYKVMEENTLYRKNIKYTDSGVFFRFLCFKLFKDYNIDLHDEEIDFKKHDIIIKKV